MEVAEVVFAPSSVRKIPQYDAIAAEYDKAHETIAKRYTHRPTFVGLCGDLSGKRVIDLGCGTGASARLIAEQCQPAEIVGIDVSSKSVEIAKRYEQQHPLGIRYVVGDVFQFDFKKLGTFDVATALFLLHYADSRENLYRLCKNIFSGLGAKGRFVTVNSNPDFPILLDKKYENTVEARLPLQEGNKLTVTYYLDGQKLCSFQNRYWQKQTYKEALTAAGFRKVQFTAPIVSQGGYKKFGQEFWQEYLQSPQIMGIVCEK